MAATIRRMIAELTQTLNKKAKLGIVPIMTITVSQEKGSNFLEVTSLGDPRIIRAFNPYIMGYLEAKVAQWKDRIDNPEHTPSVPDNDIPF